LCFVKIIQKPSKYFAKERNHSRMVVQMKKWVKK
jgi:hypothetical protein